MRISPRLLIFFLPICVAQVFQSSARADDLTARLKLIFKSVLVGITKTEITASLGTPNQASANHWKYSTLNLYWEAKDKLTRADLELPEHPIWSEVLSPSLLVSEITEGNFDHDLRKFRRFIEPQTGRIWDIYFDGTVGAFYVSKKRPELSKKVKPLSFFLRKSPS